MLATPAPSLEPPLSKLISFTEHPSTIRRGGVASSIKSVTPTFLAASEMAAHLNATSRNSAFDKSAHARLIAPTNDSPPVAGSIDLLPQMLLPLCGPEEFDLDVCLTSSTCLSSFFSLLISQYYLPGPRHFARRASTFATNQSSRNGSRYPIDSSGGFGSFSHYTNCKGVYASTRSVRSDQSCSFS